MFAEPYTHTSYAGAELNAKTVESGPKALPQDPGAKILLRKRKYFRTQSRIAGGCNSLWLRIENEID
jgi:hypothetical protein